MGQRRVWHLCVCVCVWHRRLRAATDTRLFLELFDVKNLPEHVAVLVPCNLREQFGGAREVPAQTRQTRTPETALDAAQRRAEPLGVVGDVVVLARQHAELAGQAAREKRAGQGRALEERDGDENVQSFLQPFDVEGDELEHGMSCLLR